ncbi:MAG: hypothetical protein Q4G19_00355 [Clostridia bacterium]|nr:hypothetical protein [Clostridia bacterium]
MKKMMVMLLAVILILMPVVSGALTETDVSGEWYLTLIAYSEVDYAMDAASAGYSMAMSLKEDKSAVVVLPEGAFPASWFVRGEAVVLNVGDESYRFYLSSDGVYLGTSGNGMEMYFQRTRAAAAEQAEPVPVDSLSALKGTWKIESVLYNENYYDWAYFAGLMSLDEANNSVVVTDETVAVFANTPMSGFVPDGNGRIIRRTDSGEVNMTLALLEDGSMSMTTSNMEWLCTRAE